MSTTARLQANRANAQRSTGPKTAAGRASSAMNAFRHGLTASAALLADENAGEFRKFERRMRKALAPVGELEDALACRVVGAAWRLRRFERIEAMMLDKGRQNWRGEEVELSSGFVGLCVNGDAFSKLGRYEASIERSFFRSLHELQRLQAGRLGQEVPVPAVVDVDVDVSVRAEAAEVASRAS